MTSPLTPRLEAFLAEGRPTPYVVVDVDVVADRYRDLAHSLGDIDLYYAVKANPAPEIIAALAELGACFDVASVGEVDLCLAAGVDGSRLSFGNTVKRRDAIEYAYGHGVRLFSIDCEAELDKVIELAPGSTVSCRILCAGDGAAWPLSRKFGCVAEQAVTVLTKAAGAGLEVGVSFHVGSQQLDVEAWDGALAETAAIFDKLASSGVEPALVNVGGGFPGTYRDGVPAVDGYGTAIRAALERHLGSSMPPVVCAEPGRYLVADAGVLQTEVLLIGRKGPDDPVRWVYLDVGVFTGLVEALDESIRYRIRTPHDGEATGPVILAGPTCDSIDILYEQHPYELPIALAEGDRLELLSTGAYTTTYSSVAFNGFPPLKQFVIT